MILTILLVFYVIRLLFLKKKIKGMGELIIRNYSTDSNRLYDKFINLFIILSLISSIVSQEISYSNLLYIVFFFVLYKTQDRQSEFTGLYTEGIIRSMAFIKWDMIHSITIVNNHKVTLLSVKGTATDLDVSFDSSIVLAEFNKRRAEPSE